MPVVSAVILNYNGAPLLPDCLESLLGQDYPSLEILVVDNASTDDSRAVVGRYPGIRWLALTENRGLGPGYNAGAACSKGEYLFFTNNDTAFNPDCVRQLVEAFCEDVFATDPLQMDWRDEQVLHGAQRFRFGWRYGLRPVPGMDPYQILDVIIPTEIPWAGAGAMLVDRKKFEALGGFDPTFFLDYEDLDICWRAGLRGWKSLFVPSARLRHRVGGSGNVPGVNARRALSQIKNVQRLIWKMMPWPLVVASIFGTFLRAGGAAVCGRFRQSGLRIKTLFLNLRELPEILAQRRRLLRAARTTSGCLLKRTWA